MSVGFKIFIQREVILPFILLSFLLPSCTQQDYFMQDLSYIPAVSTLPVLRLQVSTGDCDSIHRTTNYKADANGILIDSNGDTIYDGYLQIKSRGNSSFRNKIKKPYMIKFHQKTLLFDLPISKKYILLANASDWSFIRNAIAFDLAHRVGMPAPKYTYLRVYINNDYRGLYQLTNRKYLYSSNDIHTYIRNCYIIDHTYKDFDKSFKSAIGRSVRIMEPKHIGTDDISRVKYIYDRMEAAVNAPSGYHPITGEHYSTYLDVHSFAKYYLIEELMRNNDVGTMSFMMHIHFDSTGEKVYAGPMWDFDAIRPDYPNELWACARMGLNMKEEAGGVLYHLWQHEDFQNIVKEEYIREVLPQLENMLHGTYIDSLHTLLHAEAMTNNQRWKHPEESFDISIEDLHGYLIQRKDFLQWLYSSTDAERVCLTIYNKEKINARRTLRYAKKEDGLLFSPHSYSNNHQIATCYFANDKHVIVKDTVFHTNADIIIEYKYLTWIEYQLNRIKRKFHKIRMNCM